MTDQPAQNLSPDHLLTLYKITGQINSSLDFDEVLNSVMESVMEVTKAQRGFLMIADDETGELHTLVVKGLDSETLDNEGYSTTIVKEVVNTRQPLLTNNAQFDTRYQAGQSIIMRGLRAILCAPMVVQDRLVGVVYVDTAMRAGTFSPADRDLLSLVAGQAGVAVENARLYTVAVEKGRMEKELQMAADIQESLLPRHMPDLPGYEIVPLWQAARETGGDFYDAFALGDDRFGAVMADVSDKGAGAALFMAVARTMIRSHAHAGLSPVETIGRTNDLILEDAESGMFVTVYHSHFYEDGRSYHVNAGHNPPLLYRHADQSVEMFPIGGRAIGWFPDNPLSELEVQLEPGDVIVYYTDGVTDAENPQGDPYGEARLAGVLESGAGRSAHELLELLMEDVEAFCDGEPPFDDITVMIVRYTG
jgi:phosphoserine phosphatase RsbU/P